MRLAAGETRRPGVRTELALPGEPHHDHGREDSEQELGDRLAMKNPGP